MGMSVYCIIINLTTHSAFHALTAIHIREIHMVLQLRLRRALVFLPLLKPLFDFGLSDFDDLLILNGRRDIDFLVIIALGGVLDKLSEHAAQRLPASRLGNHAFTLDDAAQAGDVPDLRAHNVVDAREELLRWGGG